MASEQPIAKSFVKGDDRATIVCPVCQTTKTISVTQFRNNQHVLKVKCKCQNNFKVQLEFRRHFRKKTGLPGTFDINSPGTGGGLVTVTNLSLSGACFEVRGVHDIKIGQHGSINFTLDNRKQSVFYKSVTVRSVRGNSIGCEFSDTQAFEKELGFYLRP